MATDPIIELHRTAIADRASAYHDFISTYSKKEKILYGFVEGKHDPSFYRGAVEQIKPEDWKVKLIPAGNKKKVYSLHKKIDWRRYKKARICFFVDRDLSDLIPENWPTEGNIFVTPKYSIENHFANRHVCDRTLTEIFALNNLSDQELNSILELFERQLEEFFKFMVPIMARILRWRADRENASLDNIKLSKLFEFEDGIITPLDLPSGVTSVDDFIHIKCKLPTNEAKCIADTLAAFSLKKNYRKFIRGKYILWFVIEFCKSIHLSSSKLFNAINKKPKALCELTSANGVTILGPRVKLPKELTRFLRSNYLDYIDWHKEQRLMN